MLRFKQNLSKYFWFTSGLAIGYTLISLGHAALPKRVTTPTKTQNGSMVSEIRGSKVNSPEFEQDFAALNHAESKYAENWDQQQRIRQATSRSPRAQNTRPAKRRTN